MLLAAGVAAGLAGARPLDQSPLGRRAFVNSRDPPFYIDLSAMTAARVRLGHAVFNTPWEPAGTPGAADHDGVGPLFNSFSCDECHNEGADGHGPLGDGPAPQALVVELQSPLGSGATAAAAGDPTYGHVLNTVALPGVRPEASVEILYQERTGRYDDGSAWHLRAPHYVIGNLGYGPLAATTIIEPRLAPQLFGDGLLEAVPEAIITGGAHGAGRVGDVAGAGNAGGASVAGGAPAWQWLDGRLQLGRFGWQGVSVSIRDQTTKAFAREMGVTSRERPHDDCTVLQRQCRSQPNGGDPEVSDALLDAVVAFEQWLAVPTVNAATAAGPPDPLFVQLGCAGCHRPRLPVRLRDPDGRLIVGTIAPYTDLRLHDLGMGLADRDVTGQPVVSRWRTAPLWGLGYRVNRERQLTLLHDGRARSIEEAILWHGGEARAARESFERLPRARRQALLAWLASL